MRKISLDLNKINTSIFFLILYIFIYLKYILCLINIISSIFFRFLWPVVTVLLALISCSFELMFIYHGVDIGDYSFATECFCYFLIIFTIPIVYISVLFNRNNIMQILDTMNRDFIFICSLGSKYRLVCLFNYYI